MSRQFKFSGQFVGLLIVCKVEGGSFQFILLVEVVVVEVVVECQLGFWVVFGIEFKFGSVVGIDIYGYGDVDVVFKDGDVFYYCFGILIVNVKVYGQWLQKIDV